MNKPKFNKTQLDDTRIIDLNCRDLRIFIDDIISGKFEEFSKTHVPPSPTSGELLTRAKAAELLNITLPTLDDWTKSGKLKKCKIAGSRRIYYIKESIYAALQDQPNRVRK